MINHTSASFYDQLNRIMNCKGISEEDLLMFLKDQTILTDTMIFTISRYLDNIKGINIFFTKMIGSIEVRTRFFDIAMDYLIYNKDKKICSSVSLNFSTLTLIVEFPLIGEKYIIGNDLLDFDKSQMNKLSILRMQVLNDLLTRYYSKILYSIYSAYNRRR